MKKISIIFFVIALFVLNSCEECEVCEECPECPCEDTVEKFPAGNYVLLDNKIFSLNEQNAGLQELIDVKNVHEDQELYQLTFDTKNQKFFTIVNYNNNPQLGEITIAGDFRIIGPLLYNSKSIAMVESIEFHPIDNKLYASASLNGGLDQNDFWSESLISINPNDANCVFTGLVETDVITPETDIDNMTINAEGVIYTIDAAPPGSNYTKIFKFPYMSSALLAFQTSFLPFTKIFFSDDNLFIVSERVLYKVNLNDKASIENIGITHQEDEYNGQIVAGATNIRYQLNY